jgi:DNA polymerase-1
MSGDSGNLVRQVTNAIGIDRKDLWYSSALMCNYPKGKKPGPKDFEACNGRLIWDLQQLPNLKVVVAMGNMALQALMPDRKSISKEQYNVYWHPILNCFVVPSYHPGMCFANVEAFDDMVWSLERAKSLLDKPKQHLDQPPIKLRVAGSTGEALEMLHEIALIREPTWVAMDWESDGVDVLTVPTLALGFSLRDGEAYVIPWVTNEPAKPDPKHDLTPTVTMLGMMHRIADNKNVKLVFHNGDFDVRLTYYNTSALVKISYDTMLSDYALDERGGGDDLEGTGGGTKIGSHRLKSSARRYLYVPDWELDIKTWLPNKKVPYSNIPRPMLYQYLAYDVVHTRRLRAKHERLLLDLDPPREPGYWSPHNNLHRLMLPAQNEITRMEIEGIPINRAKAASVSETMQQTLADLATRIRDRALVLGFPTVDKNGKPKQFNQRSFDDLAELFYDVMKIPITRDLRTALDGKPIDTERPTGKDPITKMRGMFPGEPLFEDLLKYKTVDKMHGTYVESVVENSMWDGNVHGEFCLTVARTGRLASKKPNVQNIDPETKEFYEPDQGEEFWNADYKQLEVRVAAVYSGDKNLIEATKGDIHGVISREIFEQIYVQCDKAETITDLYHLCLAHKVLSPVERVHATKPFTDFGSFSKSIRKRLRDAAKPIIFGVIYGREAYSLANGPLNCSEAEAQRYINALFTKFPDLHRWLESQKQMVEDYGWIESFTGRRRRFNMVTPDFKNRILKQAINAPVQGGASDICLMAFTKLAPALRERGLGRCMLLVHDAIGGSMKKETRMEAMRLIKTTMESVFVDPRVKYEVELKTGPNYGDLHDVEVL